MNIRDFYIKMALVLFLFIAFKGNGQDMNVSILCGAAVTQGSTISINAGNSINFRIINTRSDCGTLKVENIILSNTTDFSVFHKNISYKIKSSGCKRGGISI